MSDLTPQSETPTPTTEKITQAARETIYLCNFRVSVDGEWLCLRELNDISLTPDPEPAHEGNVSDELIHVWWRLVATLWFSLGCGDTHKVPGPKCALCAAWAEPGSVFMGLKDERIIARCRCLEEAWATKQPGSGDDDDDDGGGGGWSVRISLLEINGQILP